MTRILALSDTQLGAGKNLSNDRLADQEAVLERIAQIAAEEDVRLVLHVGDVFDSRHPDEEARMVFKRFVARVAPERSLVVVAGNHDLRNAALASAVDLYDGCTFVRDPRVIDLGDCAIACLPWCPPGQYVAGRNGGNRDQANQEIGDLLVEVAEGLREQTDYERPAILALHWWISGATSPTGYGSDPGVIREPVIPLSGLTELGFDAVIAGHVHRPQVLHEGPPVFYCGPPSVCDWGEVGTKHGVWIIDTDHTPVSAAPFGYRFVRIEDRPFVTVDVDLTLLEGGVGETAVTGSGLSQSDGDGLSSVISGPPPTPVRPSESALDETDRITAAIAEHFPLTGAVVRVRFKATPEQAGHVDHAALRGLLADAGVHKVFGIFPEIVKADRARIEGLNDEIAPLEALDAWIEERKPAPSDEQARDLRDYLAALLDELGPSARIKGGGYSPRRITATDYRTFETLDVEIPAGLVSVIGPNGAGKSALVNALELGLFANGARDLKRQLRRRGGDALSLGVEFVSGVDLYRTRWGYSARGAGKTTLDFERRLADEDDTTWFPETREKIEETKAEIEAVVGITREVFRASAFWRQKRGAHDFVEAEPRHRNDRLVATLALGVYERLLTEAKADHARIEAECATISARTAAAAEEILRRPILEGSKAELDEKAEELARRLSGLEEARKEAADKLASAREAAAELRGAREVLATREAELERVQERVDALTQEVDGAVGLAIEREQAQRLAETVPALEQELTEALAEAEAQRELTQLEAEAKRLADAATPLHEQAGVLYEKAAALERQEDEACDRCGQPLHDEARARATASYLAEANRLEKQADEVDEQVLALPVEAAAAKVAAFSGTRRQIEIQPELDLARVAATRAAEIAARLERLDELKTERELHERAVPDHIATVAEARTRVRDLEGRAPDTAGIEQHVATVESQLNGARDELAEAGRALAGVERDLERITELEQRVAGEKSKLAELQVRLETVLLAESACGRNGIPVLVVENMAVPVIEAHANELLAALGGSTAGCQIELRTQRENEGGGLRDTLDIVVFDSEGDETLYEDWSGGEQFRLGLALRLGLFWLLGLDVLVIDEPDGLDEDGFSCLAEALRLLSPRVRTIFVVSHIPALRDAFDNVIEVVKGEDGRSRIEGAVEAEAVAV